VPSLLPLLSGSSVDIAPRLLGALLHGRELVIPYAMSDSATSFATVPLDELLSAIK